MNQLFLQGTVPLWLLQLLVFLVSVLFFLTLKQFLFRFLNRIVSLTKTKLDDALIEALNLPLSILALNAAILVMHQLTPLDSSVRFNSFLLNALKAATIVAIILFIDKFFALIVRSYSEKIETLKISVPVTQGIVRSIILVIGVLMMLDSFGVSILPILTSLGIGSLAVALALQPTLENLFAGFQIAIDKPFKLGHWVRLESGEDGVVYKIGWRSTWVRMSNNNTIIIPNKLMVNSRIINYYYPSTDTSLVVELSVHYASDLEQVEKVTLEVAQETLKSCSGAVLGATPTMRFKSFGDSGVLFEVGLRANNYESIVLVKHDFIKRILARFAKEGIVIPYPVRAINYDQEKAAATG